MTIDKNSPARGSKRGQSPRQKTPREILEGPERGPLSASEHQRLRSLGYRPPYEHTLKRKPPQEPEAGGPDKDGLQAADYHTMIGHIKGLLPGLIRDAVKAEMRAVFTSLGRDIPSGDREKAANVFLPADKSPLGLSVIEHLKGLLPSMIDEILDSRVGRAA